MIIRVANSKIGVLEDPRQRAVIIILYAHVRALDQVRWRKSVIDEAHIFVKLLSLLLLLYRRNFEDKYIYDTSTRFIIRTVSYGR